MEISLEIHNDLIRSCMALTDKKNNNQALQNDMPVLLYI